MSRQTRVLIVGGLIIAAMVGTALWLRISTGTPGVFPSGHTLAGPLPELNPTNPERDRQINEIVDRVMAAALPPEGSLEASTDVEKILLSLGDQDPSVRENADMRLRNLPLGTAPIVEAQYARLKDTLDLEALNRVKQCIGTFHALSQYRKRERVAVEWWMRLGLSGYLKHGNTDPKWDDLALKFLAHWLNYVDRTGGAEAGRMARELEQLECDDPLVNYFMGRQYQVGVGSDPEEARARMGEAADLLPRTAYPAPIQAIVLANAAAMVEPIERNLHWRSILGQARRQKAFEAAMEIDGNLKMPPSFVFKVGRAVLSNPAYTREHDPSGKVFAHLEQLAAGTLEIALLKAACLRAAAESGYPWLGNAADVEAQRVKDLQEAQRLLSEAWDRDSTRHDVATEMIALEEQLADESAVEEWFKKTMALFPDDYQACRLRLYSLPFEQRLNFARELVAKGNFRSGIPELLIQYHEDLANSSHEKERYWSQPEVWQDVQLVYSRYVEVWPENSAARSAYAKYCVKCRQWGEAQNQFNRIGDAPHLGIFGSVETFRYYRRKTQRNLKSNPESRESAPAPLP